MRARLALLATVLVAAYARAGEPARYALRYDAPTRTLDAELCLGHASPSRRFAGDASAPGKVADVTRSGGGALQRDGDGWRARDWRAGECLRWRADLGRIARQVGSSASRAGGDLTVTDPGGWLLQADGVDAAGAEVWLPPGTGLSVPWTPLPAARGARQYRIRRTPTEWLARAAFGPLGEATLELPGGRLHVAIAGAVDAAQRTRLLGWLQRVGAAAIAAFGRLPLPDVQMLVVPVGVQREAVVFGQSTRGQGNGLTLYVDASQDVRAFERDWVAVHELSHLFHPQLGARGAWLAEGLAT